MSAYDRNDLALAKDYRSVGDPAQARAARALLFAGTVIGLIGVANVIQGIGVAAGGRVYPANAVLPIADKGVWGWVVAGAGIAQVLASFAIFTRSPLARWFGVAVCAANAFSQLLVIPGQPFWGLAALAADLVVIKILVVHGATAPLS